LLLCLIFSFRWIDFLGFYIFFEFSLIPLIFLFLGWGYQRERIQATFYLLIYTLVGSFPLLFIFLILFTKIRIMWSRCCFLGWKQESFYVVIFRCFILRGFFIKLPAFGFHLWLPKAHVEAPVSGSIILAAILLKFRAYGVYRTMCLIRGGLGIFCWWVLFLIFGSFLRRLVALSQRDIKSLVAYSSIRHMGGLLSGIILFSSISCAGSFIIIIAHGFCSSALFFLVSFFLWKKFYSTNINSSRYPKYLYGFIFLMVFFSKNKFFCSSFF